MSAHPYDLHPGVLTHSGFQQCLSQAFSPGTGKFHQHAVLQLGLEGLAGINELRGYAAGDQLLAAVARVLRRSVRRGAVARLGGGTFGILLNGYDVDGANLMARTLVRDIDALGFEWDHRLAKPRAFVGGVVATKPADIGQALSLAQTASRIARAKFTDKVHIADIQDATVMKWQDELLCVARLNHALENDSFVFYKQQLARLRSPADNEHYYELLVRALAPDGSIVLPCHFIPAAERFHVVDRLDRHLVGRALQILGYRKSREGMLHGIAAINISAANIADRSFVDYLSECIRRNQLSPADICLEITETAAISDMAGAGRFVSDMRALGAHVAIDDFGSGNASFEYLHRLPVDYLKVDGSLIERAASSAAHQALLEVICSICRSADIKTIAECVEDEPMLERVRSAGFDYAQGAVIHLPSPWLRDCALHDADLPAMSVSA
jgi:diguanylate cyclase (GGDEF)-like protein